MNRAKILFTLLLVGIVAALLAAQQEAPQEAMPPDLRAFEHKVDLRTMMAPDDFKAAGLQRLSPDELENLNKWIAGLLAEARGKQPAERAARPSPFTGRTRCAKGCNRYSCNKENCGDNCKAGPNCRGCWKS